MDPLADIFPSRAAFSPAADADAFFASIPAKGCVALLLDSTGGPLQLLCTKNLRAMLRRRLGAPEEGDAPVAPSKRVDYRSLVSGVAWRRVDGSFEMDLVYIEAARVAFPTHWRQLIPDRAAHFVAIDVREDHPDFIRTTDVSRARDSALFGPFADRAKADRWIETAREAFDLCRYRNILVQAPRGRACAYKQMNKCSAPCDGTVPLEAYRADVSTAVAAIRSPKALLAELEQTMRGHAGRLEFEEAGRVKGRLSTLMKLCDGTNRSIRPIDEFHFISVQPGPRKGTAKVFVITASAVVETLAVLDAAAVALEQVTQIFDAQSLPPSPWPAEVLLGTVCFHLAGPKTAQRFVARRDLTPARFASLLADATSPPTAPDESGEAIRETRLQV